MCISHLETNDISLQIFGPFRLCHMSTILPRYHGDDIVNDELQ